MIVPSPSWPVRVETPALHGAAGDDGAGMSIPDSDFEWRSQQSPVTATGVSRAVVVPSPSSPLPFEPQHLTPTADDCTGMCGACISCNRRGTGKEARTHTWGKRSTRQKVQKEKSWRTVRRSVRKIQRRLYMTVKKTAQSDYPADPKWSLSDERKTEYSRS